MMVGRMAARARARDERMKRMFGSVNFEGWECGIETVGLYFM